MHRMPVGDFIQRESIAMEEVKLWEILKWECPECFRSNHESPADCGAGDTLDCQFCDATVEVEGVYTEM